MHRAHYRNPDSVPPGRVLVVGAANSGCQIAHELSATHSVELSAGMQIPTIPQRPFGRDVWWWASGLRLDRVGVKSRLGQRLAGRDQIIGVGPRHLTRQHRVAIRPRASAAAGRTVSFADGSTAEFEAVVWATGYATNHAWIDVPEATDRHGRVLHDRGVTRSPGLYTLGMAWQNTRGSAMLGWVGRDAAHLAQRIASQSGQPRHAGRVTARRAAVTGTPD